MSVQAPAVPQGKISMLNVTNEVAKREVKVPPKKQTIAPMVESKGIPVTLIRGDVIYR